MLETWSRVTRSSLVFRLSWWPDVDLKDIENNLHPKNVARTNLRGLQHRRRHRYQDPALLSLSTTVLLR